MEISEKIEAYFAKEGPFKKGIAILRGLANKTGLEERYKWGVPIYTIANKNVLGILVFKNHFGIWFFDGAFLKDPKKVLENAQEGKTKAMRQWKFNSIDEIDAEGVLAYMQEAIANRKKGITLVPKRKKNVEIPTLLKEALAKKPNYKKAFDGLSPFKQREYGEYISGAKQDRTKLSRLEKILPMIAQGVGLNDAYR